MMHLDATYVKMPKVARATPQCKKCSKGDVKVVLAEFGFMRLETTETSPIVKSGSMRDTLAKRMWFKYDQQHVKDCKVIRTEIKYISLDEIVRNSNDDLRSAHVQQQPSTTSSGNNIPRHRSLQLTCSTCWGQNRRMGGRLLIVSGSSATSLCIKRYRMLKRRAATSVAREKEAANRDVEAFDDTLEQVGFCCLNKRLLQCVPWSPCSQLRARPDSALQQL